MLSLVILKQILHEYEALDNIFRFYSLSHFIDYAVIGDLHMGVYKYIAKSLEMHWNLAEMDRNWS